MDDNRFCSMPVLALRGLVCFPLISLHFEVGRKKSIKALEYAMEHDRKIFLVSQMDIATEDPDIDELYEVGCIARITQMLRMPDKTVKVLVEGVQRAEFEGLTEDDGVPFAKVWLSKNDSFTDHKPVFVETYLRALRNEFETYLSKGIKIAPNIAATVAQDADIGYISDFITFNIPVSLEEKNEILAESSVLLRSEKVVMLLKKESEIVEIDRKIGERVKVQIDENQREYYLREQLKAINFELYGENEDEEFDEYLAKIDALNVDDKIKEKLVKEVSKLQKMPAGAHEATVVRNYLDLCTALPWGVRTAKAVNLKKAAAVLERDFYAMQKVKERILEMLAVYALAPDIKGQIICLVGPPGVGKTSIGRCIAECMGRSFARISLGGVCDEAEIRGHRKTYIGAMPGRIISAVKDAGSQDPLILLDEIDKLGKDYKGDPAAALLEVLDGEQNNSYVDHFVDMPFDLSHALFLTTANTEATIPEPLRDRMEIISLTSYTREEKFHIAKKHLVKKQIKNHGLTPQSIRFTDEAIYAIVDYYTREAGVRKLERTIAAVCRKSAKLIASGEKKQVRVTEALITSMLGKRRYQPEEILPNSEVGIINGLAWTSVGGEIMQLEVAVLSGSGKLELTGSLGDVMKESAKSALSYVRANAVKYGIDPDFYKDFDIHIQATEGAVPKDGPSAGVTITTALVSALTGRPVRRDIAMTGEVTIKGRVLPIGGLKEKAMAAYRAGVKTVFIPSKNAADLDEVDSAVLENVTFISVDNVDEIIEKALTAPQKTEELPGIILPKRARRYDSGIVSQ